MNTYRSNNGVPVVGEHWSINDRFWFFLSKNHKWVNNKIGYPKHVYKAINYWGGKINNEEDFFYIDSIGSVIIESTFSYEQKKVDKNPFNYKIIKRDSLFRKIEVRSISKNEFDSILISWKVK